MSHFTSKLTSLLEHSMLLTHKGSFLSTPLALNPSCLSRPVTQNSRMFRFPLSQASNHNMSQVSNSICMTRRFQFLKLFYTLETHILGMKKIQELGENWAVGSIRMQLKETQTWNGLIGRNLKILKLGEIIQLYWQWLDKESINKKGTKHLN